MTTNERIKNIYATYLDKINPMIVEYEVLENNFPISVFNEIRAAFIHLAKVMFLDSREKKNEVSKAERHIERLLRDCYKYNCVALEKKYCEYIKCIEAFGIDTVPYFLMHESAIKALFDARVLEGSVHFDDREKEIYENYLNAYNTYKSLNTQLLNIIQERR